MTVLFWRFAHCDVVQQLYVTFYIEQHFYSFLQIMMCWQSCIQILNHSTEANLEHLFWCQQCWRGLAASLSIQLDTFSESICIKLNLFTYLFSSIQFIWQISHHLSQCYFNTNNIFVFCKNAQVSDYWLYLIVKKMWWLITTTGILMACPVKFS